MLVVDPEALALRASTPLRPHRFLLSTAFGLLCLAGSALFAQAQPPAEDAPVEEASEAESEEATEGDWEDAEPEASDVSEEADEEPAEESEEAEDDSAEEPADENEDVEEESAEEPADEDVEEDAAEEPSDASEAAEDEVEDASSDEADDPEVAEDDAQFDESQPAEADVEPADEEAAAEDAPAEEEEEEGEVAIPDPADRQAATPAEDAPAQASAEDSPLPPAAPPPPPAPDNGRISDAERAEMEQLFDETQARETPSPDPTSTPQDPNLPRFDAEMALSQVSNTPDTNPEIEGLFPDAAIPIYRDSEGGNGCGELDGGSCLQRLRAAGGYEARSYPERSTCEGLSGGNGCMSFDGKGWFPRCDPTHANVVVLPSGRIRDEHQDFLDLTGGARLSQVLNLIDADTTGPVQTWCAKKP